MHEAEQRLLVVQEWVAKAEGDWLTAQHLLGQGAEWATDAIHFHAQQCAEKYLKAVLVLHGLPVPRIHDVEELVRLVPIPLAAEVTIEQLRLLTTSAVIVGYPGPSDTDYASAEQAFQAAAILRKTIRMHLSVRD